MEVREYRKKLVEAGQSSPTLLTIPVIKLFRKHFGPGIKILDVGCGLGLQMKHIKSKLENYFSYIEGIDWSPATVKFHSIKKSDPYDVVRLCSSDKLPYENNEFDICLSMENLEHLYEQKSINAINEMKRVANFIVITTPCPDEVVNYDFLHHEINAALYDPLPLKESEFICLESAVHKSVLIPKSLRKAGFRKFSKLNHSFFWAKSDAISLKEIICIGIRDINQQQTFINDNKNSDYRGKYLNLLVDSLALDQQLNPFKSRQIFKLGRLIINAFKTKFKYLLNKFFFSSKFT